MAGEPVVLGFEAAESAASLAECSCGYNRFVEAMLEHGKTLHAPLSWNAWRTAAAQVMLEYPGVSRRPKVWTQVHGDTYEVVVH